MATTKGSGGEHAGVHFDQNDDSVVVVIGSGAGGGTMVHDLTKAGVDGLQICFYDFEPELEFFAERVMPLLRQAGLRL